MNLKKIGLFVLAISAWMLIFTGTSSATPTSEADVKAIQSPTSISTAPPTGSFLNAQDIVVPIGGTNYVFTDSNPYDTNYTYVISGSECFGEITFTNTHPGLVDPAINNRFGKVDIDFKPPNANLSGHGSK